MNSPGKNKRQFQLELATTKEESAALRKENDAIQGQLDVLVDEIKAMRRPGTR